jgi:hypothetical protein
LSVEAGSVLDGPVRLAYRLEGQQYLAKRLLALQQWEALLRLRRVPRPLFAPRLNAGRAVMLIRTLNALAVQTGARGVAIAVFGADIVARDWSDDSDYLRMKTRRLINLARRHAEGGYRAILLRGH